MDPRDACASKDEDQGGHSLKNLNGASIDIRSAGLTFVAIQVFVRLAGTQHKYYIRNFIKELKSRISSFIKNLIIFGINIRDPCLLFWLSKNVSIIS